MVKANDAFKAGCFGAAGVWAFFVALPIAVLLGLYLCGGLWSGIRTGILNSPRAPVLDPPWAARKAQDKPPDAQVEPIEPEARAPHIPDLDGPEAILRDVADERKQRALDESRKLNDDPERLARGQLEAAKGLLKANPQAARKRLWMIVENWPETEAGREAKELVK